MKLANRRVLAKRISNKTGYFQQDIEQILDAEENAIHELIKEDYNKIKIGKTLQIELQDKDSEKAWDGIRKKYFQLPKRKKLKIKPLTRLKETIEEVNKELDK